MKSVPLYTPWLRGRYDVSPGLRPLGADFGNGALDAKVFLFGDDSERLIDNKRTCLRERRGKYVRAFRLSRDVKSAAVTAIASLLARDYPERFSLDDEGADLVLVSGDSRWNLTIDSRHDSAPALDFLGRIVAEDFAVVASEGEVDWLAYGHICAPSDWGIEDKIGRSFAEVHGPVPGFERTSAVAPRMLEAMTQRGPWVRFVWGLESDDRPNHHPVAPEGDDQVAWSGRQFSMIGRFWVRVERQCIVPLPEVSAALFTIRPIWVSDSEILADDKFRVPLIDALQGMDEAERAYKGVANDFDGLMKLLQIS